MIKKAIMWIGGILLVIGLGILGRDGRQLRRTEKKRDEILAGDIVDNLDKAESLSKKAEVQKKNAEAAAAATAARLEKISEKPQVAQNGGTALERTVFATIRLATSTLHLILSTQ